MITTKQGQPGDGMKVATLAELQQAKEAEAEAYRELRLLGAARSLTRTS